MKKFLRALVGVGACVAVTAAAYASVTFDSTTGTGFVGKGDVQLVLGLNNSQLQSQASSLVFTVSGTSETVSTWYCINTKNEKVQDRTRTTTTTTQGVVSSVARVKSQITGFNLTGYAGGAPTVETSTEGPPLNSCPTFWVWEEGSTTTEETSTSGLYVNGALLQ